MKIAMRVLMTVFYTAGLILAFIVPWFISFESGVAAFIGFLLVIFGFLFDELYYYKSNND